MKNWNSWHIHNWTTKATDNYHRFVLADNVASGELERLRADLKAHEVQWNRLQDAIAGMEKTMEAHGIDYFKWQPMTFDETLKGDAP